MNEQYHGTCLTPCTALRRQALGFLDHLYALQLGLVAQCFLDQGMAVISCLQQLELALTTFLLGICPPGSCDGMVGPRASMALAHQPNFRLALCHDAN